ncbi:MAG TPA: 1,4-dihydroxy-2-naphthoate polyprenyltransferase [Acidimicrobiales bacterium]|nr:1,4-dihydroxy-2-naphthoate polyprenyltransferase [Acidimicrobiales bacterium]
MTADPAALAPRPAPSGAGAWLAGARPRTLPAAVVPVAVGTAVAHAAGRVTWWHAVLALVVALAMQVGTNYANDYSDGVRGTDEARVGPVRLVAGGIATPRAVKRAAIATFAVGAAAGLVLSIATSPWLLAAGAASIAAGGLYTGGPRPYGYIGLGEVFVFVFFGLVATVGTAYVASGELTALAFVAAVPVGLLAVALLVVNNLRDIPTDTRSGKRTLAVVLGDPVTRRSYAGVLALAVALAAVVALFRPYALLGLLAAAVAVRPARVVLGGASGRDLVAALQMTGALQIAFGALLTLGIAL